MANILIDVRCGLALGKEGKGQFIRGRIATHRWLAELFKPDSVIRNFLGATQKLELF